MLLVGCSGADLGSSYSAGSTQDATEPSTRPAAPRLGSPGEPAGTSAPAPAGRATAARPRQALEPRRSSLSIPELGLRSVPVVRYVGTTDDARGTVIQNRGPTASPRGPRGGVGPGEVGNFLVTGHRTSHAAPFADLPALGAGDQVRVWSGPAVYVYRITATRRTSFRSARSLAEQRAAVPGHPGEQPVRAMITLSTCATPEDHAAGNYWSDLFGNPEHRIDKVGVLVAHGRARR